MKWQFKCFIKGLCGEIGISQGSQIGYTAPWKRKTIEAVADKVNEPISKILICVNSYEDVN
jgi:hypothetical protein